VCVNEHLIKTLQSCRLELEMIKVVCVIIGTETLDVQFWLIDMARKQMRANNRSLGMIHLTQIYLFQCFYAIFNVCFLISD
jgi:hypothetical protein